MRTDTENPRTPKERMAAYRARMRAKGMRLMQRWVYDTSSPEFLAEARRQSRLVAQSKGEQEVLDWLEAIADIDDKPYDMSGISYK